MGFYDSDTDEFSAMSSSFDIDVQGRKKYALEKAAYEKVYCVKHTAKAKEFVPNVYSDNTRFLLLAHWVRKDFWNRKYPYFRIKFDKRTNTKFLGGINITTYNYPNLDPGPDKCCFPLGSRNYHEYGRFEEILDCLDLREGKAYLYIKEYHRNYRKRESFKKILRMDSIFFNCGEYLINFDGSKQVVGSYEAEEGIYSIEKENNISKKQAISILENIDITYTLEEIAGDLPFKYTGICSDFPETQTGFSIRRFEQSEDIIFL